MTRYFDDGWDTCMGTMVCKKRQCTCVPVKILFLIQWYIVILLKISTTRDVKKNLSLINCTA